MKTLIIFRLWGPWPYHCTSSNSPGILYELSFSMSFVDSRSEDQTREKGNQPLSERVIDHSGSFGETWRVDVLQGPPLGQKCHHLDTILSCFPFAHLLSHLCAHEWDGITVWDEGLQLNICKVLSDQPQATLMWASIVQDLIISQLLGSSGNQLFCTLILSPVTILWVKKDQSIWQLRNWV